MPTGMARGSDDADAGQASEEFLPTLDRYVQTWNLRRFVGRPYDAAAGHSGNFRIAPHMVGMMMGIQNMADAPAAGGRGIQNRTCQRRVNGKGQAAFRFMNQIGVIV